MSLAPHGTTADTYTDANTWSQPNTVAGWLTISSQSSSAVVLLYYGRYGQPMSQDPVLCPQGTYQLIGTPDVPISEVQLRSAVAGDPVTYTGAMYVANEPGILAGAQFSGTLTAGGGFTPPVSGGMTGDIVWTGATSRTGALFCDGSAVLRTTYAALFTAIGTTFGAGDGSTTFNVPDLRDRVAVGAGGNTALAANEGVAHGSRTATLHHHPVHVQSGGIGLTPGGTPYTMWPTDSPANNETTAGNSAVSNGAPYLGLNPFILT